MGCAEEFIKNIEKYGKKTRICKTIELKNLPPLVDNTDDLERLIPKSISKADIILDYSGHPDIPYALKSAKKVITTSRCNLHNVISVDCFCAADISEEFGIPKFQVKTKGERIEEIKVIKSSPCGAAYSLAEKLKGMLVKKAISKSGLLTQYICKGRGGPRSNIHKAAEIHKKAIEEALLKNANKMSRK